MTMHRKGAIILCTVVMAIGLVTTGKALWIKSKAVVAQVLLERAFDETVRTGQSTRPWSWADTHPVAVIRSPRLNQRAIVLSNASGEAMAFGPGHVAETPSPGEPGTSVIAAHRDTHFRFLQHLQPGDTLHVTRRDGKTYTFIVTGSRIVPWDRPDIAINAPGRNLALATCWPFNAITPGPLRYVVVARLET
jgi:sortase A